MQYNNQWSSIKRLEYLGTAVRKLKHCGPVTQICVFGLQLWKMDDAKLPFNTRLVFMH
jgi:hypothetical protein